MLLLSLLSVIDDRKYVIFLRKVENEGTIIKNLWNFDVYVRAGLGGTAPPILSLNQLDWVGHCPPAHPPCGVSPDLYGTLIWTWVLIVFASLKHKNVLIILQGMSHWKLC